MSTACTPPAGSVRRVTIDQPIRRRRARYTAYVILRWSHWDDGTSMVVQHYSSLSRARAGKMARKFCREFDPANWARDA